MGLVLYNSLTRKKEPFEPISQGKVGMYVCGVTVQDRVHLGHAKSAINFDVIVRYLRHKGYDIKHVTNFTDVDDKIIARANELGVDALRLSQDLIDKYFKDMDALKIRRATLYPKASETIPDIVRMIQGLVERGYAYESNGSVYFSVRKAKQYGKLSGQTLDQMHAGARIEVGEDKKDPMDFALWKAAKPGEIFWESPWGKGRPGWHIECSAMCLKHIGKTVDIHGGGTELVFPHHENEILQSEAYNDAPFVRYWMHNGLLMINQEKMSKSLKNFFLIEEILNMFRPEVVRFYLLNASYRAPLDYNEKSLGESGKALERLQSTYDAVKATISTARGTDDAKELCDKAWKSFEEKMDDDFNTREAIAAMYELARETNRLLSEGKLSKAGAENIASALDRFNSIFDVLSCEQGKAIDNSYIENMVKARDEARMRKDYAEADRLRAELDKQGIVVQDTKDGAVWKRK
ncbi:MAG TPA: cysteine--tRNA ligase [Thermoplasmata archaeon]|nr:cysteine--tRNA ligase [Thermoplasmata archaeon]